MAKKFDFGKVKELMFEKGERFALIAVAAVTVLILFAGIFGPMAPSTSPPANAGGPTWETAIKNKAKEMDGQIERSDPGEKDIPKVKKDVDPRIALAGAVALLGPRSGFGQFLAFGARVAASKPAPRDDDYVLVKYPLFALWDAFYNPDTDIPVERVNPTILMMGTKDYGNLREVQMDYFPAPAIVLDADKKQVRVVVFSNNKGFTPAALLEPKRMVVVTMTFPIKEQLEFYREALRYPTVKQMLEKGEAPRFLGLNIWRQQTGADGKETKPVPLYQYDDKEEKTVVRSEALDTFFRKMRIDYDNPKLWAAYLGPNMVTPLPALASVQKGEANYPRLRLSGLPVAADETENTTTEPDKKDKGGFGLGKKKDPRIGIQPGKEVAGTFGFRKLKELPAELQARLAGDYNPFDPYGSPFKKDKDTKEEKKGVNFGDMFFQKKKPKDEEGKGDDEITRLLARFIDVEAQVGKSYRYWIQVRVASPNFNRTEDVAHLDIAKPAELVSDWSATPWITVPGETFFYAVDQLAFPERTDGIPAKDTGVDKDKVDADKTVVQLHRWIEKAGERIIGDWAVAERLSIRRGDVIGRKDIRIEVPQWDPKKAQFELGFYTEGKGKPKVPGIPVAFSLGDPAPILVDFRGGKHDYKIGKANIKNEDSAVEMLVLTPEGNLIVRNSRIDTDPTTDIGRFRFMHYWRWRNRVRTVRDQTSTGSPSGFPTK